jgi:glycosyltransferase EpsJ
MGLIQNRYFECLVDCVAGVFSDRSGLSAAERRRLVGEMVSSDRARLAADVARPRGMGAKAMQGPIKSGNAGLAYTEGFLASFMKRGGERGPGPVLHVALGALAIRPRRRAPCGGAGSS